nr:MAG TPA: hypothetical protein [Caudoviricetes sp.]
MPRAILTQQLQRRLKTSAGKNDKRSLNGMPKRWRL